MSMKDFSVQQFNYMHNFEDIGKYKVVDSALQSG
jgi:hypothetical protein